MTLPSFNAEQSLYRTSRHYRSSAIASAVGGIRPSSDPTQGNYSYQQTCFECSYTSDPDLLVCTGCFDACGGVRDAGVGGFGLGPNLPNAGACADSGSDIANCNGYLTCGSCHGLCP